MRLVFVALAACSHAAAPAAPTAHPAPPVPTAATENPCFAHQPPIKATAMHEALEKYAWSLYLSEDEPAPPPTTYGTCTVDRNKVTAANGTPVAELGCGVRVLTRGIVDDLGLQIGATGTDVISRKHATTALTCFPNGIESSRCRFERAEENDTDDDFYVVAGYVGDEPVTGDAALAFFRSKTILEVDVSVWCH